jgi:hypothetical protein
LEAIVRAGTLWFEKTGPQGESPDIATAAVVNWPAAFQKALLCTEAAHRRKPMWNLFLKF